jgi:hypothetical protein
MMDHVTDQDAYWPHGFFRELDELAEKDEESLGPEHLDSMYRRAADEISASTTADPARTLADERAGQAAFETRLLSRWGYALSLFDVCIDHGLKAGQWVNSSFRADAAARQDQKFEALVRLQGRAMMTAREVAVLLRSGYSSGALARWRTIHELWVVFSLLSEQSEELSRRYLVHEVVESMRAEQDYEATWETLGFDPPDWVPSERDRRREELSQVFGRAFLQNYGWAAPLFGDKAPTFRELERAAKLDHWRGHYRMASHGTHANPKGIMWNVQSSRAKDVIVAGPSNAGLVEPAQCSLIALSNICIGLLGYASQELLSDDDDGFPQRVSAVVNMDAIFLMMEKAIEAFVDSERELEREEGKIVRLVARAEAVLRAEGRLTEDEIASRLEGDPDEIGQALARGVDRGTIRHEARYFVATAPDAGGG